MDSLEFAVGDEAEVLLDVDKNGRYSNESFIENHTRGHRYALVPAGRRWWPFGR